MGRRMTAFSDLSGAPGRKALNSTVSVGGNPNPP